jgi:predicted lipoprotein with Yx(FWY)xxD motif
MQRVAFAIASVIAVGTIGACSKSQNSVKDTTITTTAPGAIAPTDSATATATPTPTPPTAADSAATSSSAGAATLAVGNDAKNGSYLTDASGRALYLFEKDSRGHSACSGECAKDWPPYTTQGTPTSTDSTLKSSLMATMHRTDGQTQVTYNGKPLYYYAKDAAAGDTKGQGLKQFGAEWYLVSPKGTKQEGKEEHKGGKSY